MKSAAVKFKRLPHGVGLPLPAYQSEGSVGLDICSAYETAVDPGKRKMIYTGFLIELERGFEAQVRPRSGLAVNHGITVTNAPGTIDWDYRGEVIVSLINHSLSAYRIKRGDRIAQLVIAPVSQALVVEVDLLGETDRGTGGFGSTGAA
jgi:dUTP pyrophosphatase